jgi:ribosomal protein S18 acetylase RimI-like enzyme
MTEIEVRKVSRQKMKDRVTPFKYESPGHYAVTLDSEPDGWTIRLRRQGLESPFRKNDEGDGLVQLYKGDSEIYLAFVGGEEAGQVQVEYEEWNRSLRVWDIDVWPGFRRKGVGTALMKKCRERAKALGARRLILETQSSNLPAVEFYRSLGLDLMGLDLYNYTNQDPERGEVRLEFGLLL